MALRDWESSSTRHHWSGIASPIKWLSTFLALSIITLVVTIPVNATVANEPDNDYAYGFGWALMMPVPIIALLWTLVDIFICRSSTLNPIYALVASILLAIGYFCVGLLTILFFSWSSEGAWVPGLFFLIDMIVYLAFMYFAARAVHMYRIRGGDKVGRLGSQA